MQPARNVAVANPANPNCAATAATITMNAAAAADLVATAPERGDQEAGNDRGDEPVPRRGAGADCDCHRQGQSEDRDRQAGHDVVPEAVEAVALTQCCDQFSVKSWRYFAQSYPAMRARKLAMSLKPRICSIWPPQAGGSLHHRINEVQSLMIRRTERQRNRQRKSPVDHSLLADSASAKPVAILPARFNRLSS